MEGSSVRICSFFFFFIARNEDFWILGCQLVLRSNWELVISLSLLYHIKDLNY